MFDFKIVILDSPYDQLHDPRVRQILNDTMQMKIDGFKTGYPEGVLPVDGADLVATHLLVCIEYGKKLLPVCGYKSLSLSKLEKHRIGLPLSSMLKSSGAHIHDEVVREILVKNNGKKIAWDYSFTILPEIRNDRKKIAEIKEIITAINIYYHQMIGTDITFASGVVKFKTDQYFNSMGFEEIYHNGEPLDLIKQDSLWGEEVRLMKLEAYSLYSKQMKEKYCELWNNRFELSKSKIFGKEAA